MPRRRARAPQANKAAADNVRPAISPCDSAALSLALDPNAPPDGVQEAILRGVLNVIDADNTQPSKS
jgi:hypothetical protein